MVIQVLGKTLPVQVVRLALMTVLSVKVILTLTVSLMSGLITAMGNLVISK